MEPEPLLRVLRPECRDRIGRHSSRSGHLRQRPTVWSPELERAVGPRDDLVAILVHRAVMAATE